MKVIAALEESGFRIERPAPVWQPIDTVPPNVMVLLAKPSDFGANVTDMDIGMKDGGGWFERQGFTHWTLLPPTSDIRRRGSDD